ncbi:ribosomal protein L1 [Auriculariales sp. MPI-PUGE-AT-0066]|nr:ribosomal protein L1 [Auriculariales sp. MPI-PUGE-AT-0066]
MGVEELIDGHVSSAQCTKAIKALTAHALKKQDERDEGELLPSKDEHVWLVIGTKTMHPEKKLKPRKIPLKHPLVDPRETSICLITKDPQREYKDLLKDKNINFVSRVVGLSKLKGKFRGFDARRALLNENGLFLADERVVPLLPKLLGSKFFNAKKQPIPVSLTANQLKTELERAVTSTYFHQNKGTCTAIKIGPLSDSFGVQKLIDNLAVALPAVVAAIKGGWDNIQNLHIKTSTSVALPIWTCELGTGKGGRWEGLTVDAEETDASEAKTSGKKRAQPEDDDESDEEEEEVKSKSKKTASASKDDAKSKAKAKDDAPPKKKRKHDEVEQPVASTSTKKDSTSKPKEASSKSVPAAKEKPASAPAAKEKPTSAPAASKAEKKSTASSRPKALSTAKADTPASAKTKAAVSASSSKIASAAKTTAPPALKSALRSSSAKSADSKKPASTKKTSFATAVSVRTMAGDASPAKKVVKGGAAKKDKVLSSGTRDKEKKMASLVASAKRRG